MRTTTTGRHQRTECCPEMVHRLMEAKGLPAKFARRDVGDQRIAGAVRTPLPNRSKARKPTTCSGMVANARSGRAMAANP